MCSSDLTDSPAEITVQSSPIGRRIVVEGPFEDCSRRQEIVLWDGLDRIEFATTIDGYRDSDRLFRIRFPAAVEGGASVSEVGNAVVGRGFGFPNVDVAKVPFTLDHPAYNWFGLSSAARIALVDDAAGRGGPRASQAISIAEVVVPDDPSQDDAVRGLVVALVRQGVTSTLSTHDGSRYGVLHIDSNLPDVRIAIQFSLARALWNTGGDRARAHELATHAFSGAQTIADASRDDLAQMQRWLASHRVR